MMNNAVINQLLAKGKTAEGNLQFFKAMEYYYQTFVTLDSDLLKITEEYNEKNLSNYIKILSSAGISYITTYVFCSLYYDDIFFKIESEAINSKYSEVFYRTLGALAFLHNLDRKILVLNLNDILDTMEQGTYIWTTSYCPTEIIIKVFEIADIVTAKKEWKNTQTIYDALKQDSLPHHWISDSNNALRISLFPGLVGVAIRKQWELDPESKYILSYAERKPPDQLMESYEKFIDWTKKNIQKNGYLNVELERQLNWMCPRTTIPLCNLQTDRKVINIYLKFRGTDFDIFLQRINDLDHRRKVREFGVDILAGFHASLKSQNSFIWNKISPDCYDYGRKFLNSNYILNIKGDIFEKLIKLVIKTLNEAPKILVHGDAKLKNFVVPWYYIDIDASEFFNTSDQFLDLPGGKMLTSPEIIPSLLDFTGYEENNFGIKKKTNFISNSYINPCIIDLESLCLAPPEHDLVRFFDDIPEAIDVSEKINLCKRYESRIKDIVDRTGISITNKKINNSVYLGILICRYLDRIANSIKLNKIENVDPNKVDILNYISILHNIDPNTSTFASNIKPIIEKIIIEIKEKFT